jgi:hypothetical protein
LKASSGADKTDKVMYSSSSERVKVKPFCEEYCNN